MISCKQAISILGMSMKVMQEVPIQNRVIEQNDL